MLALSALSLMSMVARSSLALTSWITLMSFFNANRIRPSTISRKLRRRAGWGAARWGRKKLR